MSLSRRYAVLGVVALLVLQVLWHGYLLPPETAPRWLVSLLFALPLLPSLLLLAARKAGAQFWGGVAALLYFCHGVSESWTEAQARPLALLETGLAIWIIVAVSWEGMKARLWNRKKPGSNV